MGGICITCATRSSLQEVASTLQARLPLTTSFFVVVLLHLLVVVHVKVQFKCLLAVRAPRGRVSNAWKKVAASCISLHLGVSLSREALMSRSRPVVSHNAATVFAVFSLLLLQDGLKFSHALKLLLERTFRHIGLELQLRADLRGWAADLLPIPGLAGT